MDIAATIRHQEEANKEIALRSISDIMAEAHKPLPLWKRSMDVLASGMLLIMLSPLFLVVAILIKIYSPGPVFYSSKRAGRGFKVFDFYKFRSMKVGADKMVANMKDKNQYQESVKEEWVPQFDLKNDQMLVGDESMIEEGKYLAEQAQKAKGTFFKVNKDPRITPIGQFIRKTSIDELPQLVNVFLGDMSLVGNRPLPLYEAEKLTTDAHILRFLAPAGITGYWQVTGRGKASVSEDDRKNLDVYYALNYNFWLDVKILLKTIPAALQESNV